MKKLAILLLAISLLLLPGCQATATTAAAAAVTTAATTVAETTTAATTAAATAAETTEATEATEATTTAATTTAATTAATTTAATTTAKPTTAKPENPVIRLSTTTSVNDSGLLPALQKRFEAETGYELDIISNGSGAAIALGKSGDADVLLVHSKAAEDTFVASGYGIKRIPFMHNYFVIAGPAADPANVVSVKTAVDAFKLIAYKEATFVSRGDNSGTNAAELKIWSLAGITPKGSWYVSAGAGMGACLNIAGETNAYILTDKATYLATKAQTDLAIKLGESDDLKNTYSLIAVNPAKNPGINAKGAQAFIDFMLGTEAAEYIKSYGVDKYGEPLFFYDGYKG
jgi:tungstate transport system substrate-binding protein